MTIGDILKQYREQNNISMDEFSKKSSLSKGYISMLENNVNPRNNKPIAPTLPTIAKIANGMGTDIDTLLKLLDDNQQISINPQPKINERIKQRRLALNLTLLYVAEQLGVKEATVQRYESGDIKNIKHETISQLANILKCSPAYLMGWENSISEPSFPLNNLEKEIILKFRNSDSISQAMVLRALAIDDQFNIKGDVEKMA